MDRDASATQVREIFETDCETFIVFNGTAANSLALAQLCRPFDSVLCHERAHIETDECGAPEFFSGGAKLLRVGGANGKLDLESASCQVLGATPRCAFHQGAGAQCHAGHRSGHGLFVWTNWKRLPLLRRSIPSSAHGRRAFRQCRGIVRLRPEGNHAGSAA